LGWVVVSCLLWAIVGSGVEGIIDNYKRSDVPATDPEGCGYATAFVRNGGDDEDYTLCAVAVRPPRANIYDDDACNFVVGVEDTCGFSPAPGLIPQGRHAP
jgi:hypothetical protein